jgi:hypothetical protein
MQQPVESPFGAESTAAEVLAGKNLSGKLAVVTGAGAGIGKATAPVTMWCWQGGPPKRWKRCGPSWRQPRRAG